jgi:hypothetical protein
MVETEDQPHGRGLAGAVRTQEPGHHSWPDIEAQIVDGYRRPIPFREISSFNHPASWWVALLVDGLGRSLITLIIRETRPAHIPLRVDFAAHLFDAPHQLGPHGPWPAVQAAASGPNLSER